MTHPEPLNIRATSVQFGMPLVASYHNPEATTWRNEKPLARVGPPTQGTHACSNLRLLLMRGPPRFRWGHKPMQQRQRPVQLPCTTRA